MTVMHEDPQMLGTAIIQGAVVQPGDTLVIALEGVRDPADINNIGDRITAVLPPGAHLVVVDGVRALAVIRGHAELEVEPPADQGEVSADPA